MTHADRIEVDDDEGRIILIVYTETEVLNIDIHDTVLQFYAEVQKHIRPYVLEAEDARRSHYAPQMVVEAGYELDDPKHPTYHDRMTGIYDNREKT